MLAVRAVLNDNVIAVAGPKAAKGEVKLDNRSIPRHHGGRDELLSPKRLRELKSGALARI